ncbi:MAG TPA: MSMEG_0565 family glycosyltransferase [Polyangiaceae bacterium]|nr:MSMEG_0565 family glycosyltransferase [Polyangiaceae bacterium]
MLSVGIFTYSSKPRGSVVHAAYLAEALERRGARAMLYALAKPGDVFYRPLSCELRLIPAEAAPSEMDALIRQRIAEFQRGIHDLAPRHRICHAQDCLAANALIASKTELGAASVVRTVHHVEHFESPYLTACQERSVAEADLVLSVSQVTRREVQAAFGRAAPVISNGVDFERFVAPLPEAEQALAARLRLEPDETLIASVGGVEARKNSLAALEAVALAYAEHKRLRWVIAGGASIWEHDTYRQAFAERLAELPADLQARITVLGTVSEAELTALYRLCQVLLCPSLQEGFGLCVLEALSAKCAVIVPRGAPFDEYLDERCARFVDPRSEAAIASALLGLLREPAVRRRLAEIGCERAQHYSWDRVAERHLARYEALLRRAPSVAEREQL